MTSCCPMGGHPAAQPGHRRLEDHLRRDRDRPSIGERLKAVEPYLDNEEVFLANYSDGLTDLDLGKYVDTFLAQPDKVASFLAVQSTQSFHVADVADNGEVASIDPLSESDLWINGGFFVFRTRSSAISTKARTWRSSRSSAHAERKLCDGYRGFWTAMDTSRTVRRSRSATKSATPLGRSGSPPLEEVSFDVEDWRAPLGAQVRRVLCLGAHSDDIEIGCGGTVLQPTPVRISRSTGWSSPHRESGPTRHRQAPSGSSPAPVKPGCASRAGALFPISRASRVVRRSRPGDRSRPGVVPVARPGPSHRSELVGNTFRNQLVLEYEIPKFDGDLGRPSVYVHLEERHAEEKLAGIIEGFPSQKRREWFTDETFRALLRLRGIESRALWLAEAFHCSKLVLL